MTDDWLDETKKIFDLKEQKQRMKHAAEEAKRAAKNVARFRASGINWRVVGILSVIILGIISVVVVNSVIRSLAFVLVLVTIVVLVFKALKGRVKPSFRGWVAIGIIGLISLAFVGVGLKMSYTLSTSDVQPMFHGWRFSNEDYQYYCDKSIDPYNYYQCGIDESILGSYNTKHRRIAIALSCKESTSQSWVMDMDGPRTGMPNIDVSYSRALVPCDSGGTEKDFFIFRDYEVTENITLVQTYIKTIVEVIFVCDDPYVEISSVGAAEDYFSRLDGEFYVEYYAQSEQGDLTYYNSGGRRVTGEIAFGIESGKIKWTADEVLPEAEFISTAVIGVWCTSIERYFDIQTHVGTLHGSIPGNFEIGGSYDVGQSGNQLLYRTTGDVTQKADSFVNSPLSEQNMQDNWVPQVFVSIPFDVLMGGNVEERVLPNSNPLTLVYTKLFKTTLSFVSSVVSAYDLNLQGDPETIVTTSGGGDDEPTIWDKIVEFYNQIAGWIIDFWKSTWYGKVILVAVPVVLVGVFGGASISKQVKKNKGVLGRAGGAVTQTVNVIVGDANKIPGKIAKTTKKGVGFLKKLGKKLRFWK